MLLYCTNCKMAACYFTVQTARCYAGHINIYIYIYTYTVYIYIYKYIHWQTCLSLLGWSIITYLSMYHTWHARGGSYFGAGTVCYVLHLLCWYNRCYCVTYMCCTNYLLCIISVAYTAMPISTYTVWSFALYIQPMCQYRYVLCMLCIFIRLEWLWNFPTG